MVFDLNRDQEEHDRMQTVVAQASTNSTMQALQELEAFRKNHQNETQTIDWTVRMCEAIIAKAGGLSSRNEWTDILQNKERRI